MTTLENKNSQINNEKELLEFIRACNQRHVNFDELLRMQNTREKDITVVRKIKRNNSKGKSGLEIGL